MISSTFDSERNVIVTKITGDISLADLVAEYDSIINHEQFLPNMHVIWDLSRLNLTRVPVGEIRQLTSELRKYAARRGDKYKAALVLRRGTDYQLMRMYVIILRLIGANINFRLHRSMDDAYQWVTE